MTEPTRQQEIDVIWQNNRWLWFLPGLAVGFLIGLPIRLGDQPTNWFIAGIWPETLGILFTVFLIDRLNRRRDEMHRIQDLKDDLLRRVRSPENTVAKHAVHELRERGWLVGEDGLLKGLNLWRANLQGANLWGANLERAELRFATLEGANLSRVNLQGANLEEATLKGSRLFGANLQGANLEEANLEEVDLMRANLKGAFLFEAKLDRALFAHSDLEGVDLSYRNLEEANLHQTNLEGASLVGANLQGANMTNANLEGANIQYALFQGASLVRVNLQSADLWLANLSGVDLREAVFNSKTTLPDGIYWTPDTDMARFTDPSHPNFWRSNNPHSPAYQGNEAGEPDRL